MVVAMWEGGWEWDEGRQRRACGENNGSVMSLCLDTNVSFGSVG